MTRRSETSKKRSAQTPTSRPLYPFAAIVGQEELKLGLLLNVIAPSIGGVLIMGHRGTGKSTAVRALAALLPPLSKVRNCLYGCDPAAGANLCADCRLRLAESGALPEESAPVPVVDLPLNATEDRVAGAINFERAIREGVKTFEPGLLARAHRGFLYIDEVNLLEDHLVDLLLDVAASGRNRVEREGISVEHPAEFILAGSGNPEEGELRPQLLDRFGLYTEIRTTSDLEERVEIITRREAFDHDPTIFCAAWEAEQARLRRRLARAREAFKNVRLSTEIVRGIAALCARLNVDGHRGELTIARAARALAAFEQRTEVIAEDARRVAAMALRHRLRRDPLEQTDSLPQVEQVVRELFGDAGMDESKSDTAEPVATGERQHRPKKKPPGDSGGDDGDGGSEGRAPHHTDDERTPHLADEDRALRRTDEARTPRRTDESRAPQAQNEERAAPTLDARLPDPVDEKFNLKKRSAKSAPRSLRHGGAGKTSSLTHGRYSRAVARRAGVLKVALDATLRAAAASQTVRRDAVMPGRAFAVMPESAFEIEAADLRYKHFSRRAGTLFIFAIDTSGSMAVNRISQAKGALARLLRESYVNRDRVALITFRERAARVLLQPSQSSARARRLLDALPVGGTTPLSSGLLHALEMSERAARQGTERIRLLVFTDGRANVPRDGHAGEDRASIRRRIKIEVEKIGHALQLAGVVSVIIDTQNRFTSGGEGETLAQALGGRYMHLH